MDLEIFLRNGKLYKVNKGNMYLTIQSSLKGSKIVNLETGKTLNTRQRIPEGFICHASRPYGISVEKDKAKVGTQYRYDIYYPDFETKEIEFSPTNKVHAIRLNDCKVVRQMYANNEWFYLKAGGAEIKIENVLQVFDNKHMTLKEYASNIAHGKIFDCWVTPIPSKIGDFSEWVLVPIRDDSGKWVFANPRSPYYKYTKLYEKINTMYGNSLCQLGVVVAVGKIGVKHFLVNCPLDYELGSTRLCEIRKADIFGYISVVITKSKPVQLKRKYIETFVTPGGSVLIKAIVGVPRISLWKERPEKKIVYTEKCKRPIIMDRPIFNYIQHPILGQIIFSPKMLWSVETLRVLVGASVFVSDLMQSNKVKTTAKKSTTGLHRVRYHILAFHDGVQYIRVPDVPDEMYDSKNFLIENDAPLFGQPNAQKRKILPPPLKGELKIEGRFIADCFIKGSEVLYDIESVDNEDDKVKHVPFSHFQQPRANIV